MRKPLFLRPVTADEQQAIEAGLRSPLAFTLRRAQILLASQRGLHAQQIADQLGCDDDTARRVISAFNTRGIAALTKRSSRRHHLPSAFLPAAAEQLPLLIQQSPRDLGHPTSLWTLALLAEVAWTQGLTTRRVSAEAMRTFLRQHGIRWQRAKHWIRSPDPQYTQKNTSATA